MYNNNKEMNNWAGEMSNPQQFDLTTVEKTAKEAHTRIKGTGSVSLWNVSQLTRLILRAPSWKEIGYEYEDVSTLRYIQYTEAKVNAFIHCFSSARLLATFQDLHVEICKEFEINYFEDLELGKFYRHPLVKYYFNMPPHVEEYFNMPVHAEEYFHMLPPNEICFLTTENLISQISMNTFKNNEEAETVFRGLFERYQFEQVYAGIRVQNLGTYITYLAEARGTEHALLRSIKEKERKKLETEIQSESFHHVGSLDQNIVVNEMEFIGLRLMMQEGKTCEIIQTDPSRVHRVLVTDDDIRVFVAKWKSACHQNLTEEVFQLMLNQSVPKKWIREKLILFRSNPGLGLLGVTVKAIRSGFMDYIIEGTNSQRALSMININNEGHLNDEEREFVSIWKEVCVIYPAHEVFVLMLEYYRKYGEDKGNLERFFRVRYRGLYLLHIAVQVMKTIALVDRLREGAPTGDNNIIPISPRSFGGDTSTKEGGVDVNDIISNYLEVSMNNKQIQVMMDQARKSLGSQFNLDENYFSRILENQFPSIGLNVISTESKTEKGNTSFSAPKSQTNHSSQYSVLFSSTLALTKANTDLVSDTCPNSIISDAKECLLKAPFLADLLTWSHWDRVFAPFLGPLVHWLLDEGYIEGLSCIVTHNGCVIRVDNSSSNEELSKAFLEGSPAKVACQMLSLFWRYGGFHDASKELLELYIKSAINTRINKNGETIEDISKFVLNCLGYLPSEFRDFTAELLVPVLCSFNKDAHKIMLSQCNEIEKRVMLHDLGLYLGIVDWIDDYKSFNVKDAEFRSENNESQDAPINEKANERVVDYTFEAFEESACSNMTDEGKIEYGNSVIEDIRQKEFGIETGVSSVNNEILKKQHAREGRALYLLSTELYSQDSHFILELVQNADDNSYHGEVEPTLVFIFQSDEIIVLNNEKGFSEKNIRALCNIGRSTKKEKGSNSGYIGKKGIGFKSVFRVTDAPEVHSGGFHVKFDKSEDDIGYILPTAIPPRDIKDIHKILRHDMEYQADNATWGTCIVLPFKLKHKSRDNDMSYVRSLFSELHPSLLLFLNRLKCIKYKNIFDADGILTTMRKETSDDGTVLISDGDQKTNWFVVNQDLDASQVRSDAKITRISLAFSLKKTIHGDYEPNLSKQPVFAFLPLRKYGFDFILQADFSLTSAREEVDHDSAWNQWLREKFSDVLFTALKQFCQLPCFKDKTGKAITAFMKFVPLNREIYGFFSPLPHLIFSKLRASECLLLEGPGMQWVLPSKAVRGCDDQVRDFLPDTLLKRHLGLGYLNKEIVLDNALAKELVVQEYGPEFLVKILRSVGNEKDGISNLGLEWLSSWLNFFHVSLAANSDGITELILLNELREIFFVPLSDGSYVSLKDGPVWLPFYNSGSRFGVQCGAEQFPAIYSNLRIMTPLIFTKEEEGRVDNILGLLTKLGVKKLSPHDVIKNHILMAKLDEETMRSKKNLMIEFLIFVLNHFQMSCEQCSTGKDEIISVLRKKNIILTNHGFKSPIEESIHFGKAYGNTIEVEKLIGNTGVVWNEIDNSYLKPVNSMSPSYGTDEWRNFFKDLGVNDFVQVIEVQNKVLDKFVAVDYESPELNRLISEISSRKDLDKSKYLVKLLDDYWDECFTSNSIIQGRSVNFVSTFMKTICDSKWVASSIDADLHFPSELFYECEDVISTLGSNAPYAIPKITNRDFVRILGLKDKVNLQDIARAIENWRRSDVHDASILQMSKLYSRARDEISLSTEKAENLAPNLHIFVPFVSPSYQSETVPGIFHSPRELYWDDPSGCLDMIREKISSSCEDQSVRIKTISTIYPELRDFFVIDCGVLEAPPFDKYFDILLQLSTVTSPKESAQKVFRVLMKWAEDLSTEKMNLEQLHELRNKLMAQENAVLPTINDKWVSLHASCGLVCWSDNIALIEEIAPFHAIQFLQFGQLSVTEKEALSRSVADLLHGIGIQSLSEVLIREAIFGAERKDFAKAHILNWILPYAQRYICNKHIDIYNILQESQSEKINSLRVIVVEEILYKNTVKANDNSSESVTKYNCLLQGSTLYITPEAKYPSILLELSSFLLQGAPNQEISNFLHTLIVMFEGGIKEQQLDSYINEIQQLPQLSEEENIWSIRSLTVPTIKQEQIPYGTLSVPVPVPVSMPVPPRHPKPFISNIKWNNQTLTSSNVVNFSPQFSPRQSPQLPQGENIWSRQPLPVPTSEQEQIPIGTLPVPLPIPVIPRHSKPFKSSNKWTNHVSASSGAVNFSPEFSPIYQNIDNIMPIEVAIVPVHSETQQIFIGAQDENSSYMIGREGERIAYMYFKEKFEHDSVIWVNEFMETYKPYDIYVGKANREMEYIEVKATISETKDWFAISPSECSFAIEQGDLFSVAWVFLSRQADTRISVLRNPMKLCDERFLQLAMHVRNTGGTM